MENMWLWPVWAWLIIGGVFLALVVATVMWSMRQRARTRIPPEMQPYLAQRGQWPVRVSVGSPAVVVERTGERGRVAREVRARLVLEPLTDSPRVRDLRMITMDPDGPDDGVPSQTRGVFSADGGFVLEERQALDAHFPLDAVTGVPDRVYFTVIADDQACSSEPVVLEGQAATEARHEREDRAA